MGARDLLDHDDGNGIERARLGADPWAGFRTMAPGFSASHRYGARQAERQHEYR